ncbi:hypothetical protein D3C84_690170 [compost metagenome]
MLEIVVPLALPRRFLLNGELFELDAVAKGRVLQLKARRHHLHQQGIGHRRFAADVESHHHQIADPYLGGIKRLTVAVEPAAGHAYPLTQPNRSLFGVADHSALHIEGSLALVGDPADCQRLGGAQLQGGRTAQRVTAKG